MTKDGGQRPSEAFRVRLREIRERAGLKQSDLAARCVANGELSYRQTTIAKLENGDRGVALDDVFVLADALEVHPGWLMTPSDAEALVVLSADTSATAMDVRHWIAGNRLLVPAEDLERGFLEVHRLLNAVAPEEEVAIQRWPWMHGLRQQVNHLLDGALRADRAQLLYRLNAVARIVEMFREELAEQEGEE